MARRPLPTAEEAQRILGEKRTRPPRRPPPPVGRNLTKFIKALDGRFGQGSGGLQARWREIVGDQLAQRTEPAKLTKGRAGQPTTLEIRVAGPAAALIQHQAAEILSRVNLFLGTDAVGKLRIVQGPVKPRTAAARIPPKSRKQPLDAAVEAELEQSLDRLKDSPLKAELAKLGRGVLRQDTDRR